MPDFRFAIMGAGRIARKFCDAAALVKDCTVCAVASKSLERAEALAAARRYAETVSRLGISQQEAVDIVRAGGIR